MCNTAVGGLMLYDWIPMWIELSVVCPHHEGRRAGPTRNPGPVGLPPDEVSAYFQHGPKYLQQVHLRVLLDLSQRRGPGDVEGFSLEIVAHAGDERLVHQQLRQSPTTLPLA